MSRLNTINELLNANDLWELHAKGTTNHCPMALSALYKMGADSHRLQDFFQMWEKEYAIPASYPQVQIDEDNYWQQAGKRENFPALKQYLTKKIAVDGVQQTLSHIFTDFPFAPGSGAFHGLIRLGYGLELEHSGEIAAGIAACIVGNFVVAIDTSTRLPAANTIRALQHLSAVMEGRVYGGDFIQTRLRAVIRDADFIRIVPAPPQRADLLDDIASAAIRLYLQTKNFTVLHLVTGAHAARRLLAILTPDLQQKFLTEFWLACCAAYVSAGAPVLAFDEIQTQTADASTWPQLFRLACASNDDHVIKLVYSCYCESQYIALPHYQIAAVNAVTPQKT